VESLILVTSRISYAVSAFDDLDNESEMIVPRGIRSANISKESIELTDSMPFEYKLYQAYPNPFNPVTVINFDLPEVTNVRLVVYDINGNEVAKLKNSVHEPGSYHVIFDSSINNQNLSSGVYFILLNTDKYKSIKKTILLK
jgi:hypothetical protein